MKMDLTPFTACGFPGTIDRDIAEVPVKGVDREQTQGMVRLCEATEPVLYGPTFSPRQVRYRTGSRPALEALTRALTGRTPLERMVAALNWTATNVKHPQVVGPLPGDRNLSEEKLIESGIGWCNEQSRVFIALCETMNIPARLCFLFHANARAGHATTEVWLEERWCFVDVTFALYARLPDGRLAEARDLSGPHRELAHKLYKPLLTEHYRHIQPFVENFPGWNRRDRPTPDQGGDLMAHIGICNYVIEGVEWVK